MNVKGKLKNKRGETLIEVLVSLLIIVMILVMLPSAITLASRFNKEAEDHAISTMMDRTTAVSGAKVTVAYNFSGDNKSYEVSVDAYESEEFCFYDHE